MDVWLLSGTPISIMLSMELAFATKPLRRLCESQVFAERRIGIRLARTLRHRLADIAAAENAKDLIAGRPRAIPAMPYEHLIVELDTDFEIVLKANHNSVMTLRSGAVDWA